VNSISLLWTTSLSQGCKTATRICNFLKSLQDLPAEMRYERLLSYLQRVTGTLRTQKEALQPPCAALLPFEHCILLSDLASNRRFITTCCKIFVPHFNCRNSLTIISRLLLCLKCRHLHSLSLLSPAWQRNAELGKFIKKNELLCICWWLEDFAIKCQTLE